MPTSSARVMDSRSAVIFLAAFWYSRKLNSIDSSPGIAMKTQVGIPTSFAKSFMTGSTVPAPSQVKMANISMAKTAIGMVGG